MNRIAGGLACVGLALGGSAARADWQYTRWGMTPGQVVAASHGAVSTSSGDPGDHVEGEEVGASGTYASGDFKFRAVFYFINDKLADIRLKLLGSDPYALKNSLDGVYGKPFYDSHDGFIVTYHDAKKNNRIDLVTIGDLATLEYRPLVDASASGL